jgi:type IV pilus assembly protein PilO
MKDWINKFLMLPLLYRGLIGLVVLFLALFFLHSKLLGTVTVTHTELSDKITDLEYNLSRERSTAKKLPEFQKEVASLDQKLRRILLELPDQKEIDAFLRSISVLAVDTGLEVVKFSPAGEIPREFFFELPVQIQLSGTFHQLVTFFDELSRLSGIVNVKNIDIRVLGANSNQAIIDTSFLATTYRYDENSRPLTEATETK